jgi:hypothetical protein
MGYFLGLAGRSFEPSDCMQVGLLPNVTISL